MYVVTACFACDATALVIHDSDKRSWTRILKHFTCSIRYCNGLCEGAKWHSLRAGDLRSKIKIIFIFTSKKSIPTALNSVINFHIAAVVCLVSEGMVCVVLPGLCLPGKGTESMSEDRAHATQILLPH